LPQDIVVADIAGPLFFADAAPFREAVLQMIDEDAPRALVIDLGSATQMDMDGAEVLLKLHEELARRGIKVVLASVPTRDLRLLDKVGVTKAIGKERFYVTVRDAVAAMQALPAAPQTASPPSAITAAPAAT
jgi:anti-anti-sigma factor